MQEASEKGKESLSPKVSRRNAASPASSLILWFSHFFKDIYLTALRLSCGTWDLPYSLWHVACGI